VGECAVRFDDATKSFHGHLAVSGLTLEIPRGGLFGLLGPNGAGKTTALRMATRILRPDSGRVEVLGLPAGQIERDRTGYMPEERGLYPRLVIE
jgi:ABC-2 type transport system ATP-binding protein